MAALGVREKSSTASASSLSAMLKSAHRIQNEEPFAMLSPEIVEDIAVRLAAAFPFNNPSVVLMFGLLKSRRS